MAKPRCDHAEPSRQEDLLGEDQHRARYPGPTHIIRICPPQPSNRRPVTAMPNGGSTRVIHSLCCPVGGRPASPRKSQSKSQRRPTSGDTQRRQATVKPGQVPTERHRATPSDARNMTGGQGVAGSNPAVPTGNQTFSNIITPHKSQQKSQLVVQRPFQRRVPIGCYGLLPGHFPIRQSQREPTVKGSKIAEPPLGSARRPRQLRTGGHRPGAPPADRKPRRR